MTQALQAALDRLSRHNHHLPGFEWGHVRSTYEDQDVSPFAVLARRIELLASSACASAASTLANPEPGRSGGLDFDAALYDEIQEVFGDVPEQRAWAAYVQAIEGVVNALNAA